MKSLLASILLLVPSLSLATNELDLVLNKFYSDNKIAINNKSVDDYTFVRRIYLDLAGRIPTLEEIKAYKSYQNPNKKNLLIDKLLFSEDYVNNFYNYWADLLRIRPDRLSDDVGFLKSYPYMEEVRKNIREDKPIDKWVQEMLTAEGNLAENPNSGNILRDTNLNDWVANNMVIFCSKGDYLCSGCHNQPFSDFTQLQFYQTAAFFGGVETRQSRKDYAQILKKVDEDIKKITGKDRVDNNARQFIASNLYSVKDNPNKKLTLPFDYKYPDNKPNEKVIPTTYDGKIKDPSNPRKEFSIWLTSQPDFSNTLINRIWLNIVGKPLVEPIDNIDVDNSKNKLIIQYLSKVLLLNKYQIKPILREIFTSDFYSRVSYSGPQESYKLESILVKRMSSYQFWDSLLTLILDDPNYSRISFSKYAELIEINWESISGESILKQIENLKEYEKDLNSSILKYKGVDLVRSCYLLNRSGFVNNFLKEFGSSDRILIDSSTDKGTITQVLTLMNSPLIDIIAEEKSQIVNAWKKNHKDKNILFISIMGRPVGLFEKDIVERTDIKDLIWALINTREFAFRK